MKILGLKGPAISSKPYQETMYSYNFRQVFVHVGGALCGGTILDETAILSAAHCFDNNHVRFMYTFSSSAIKVHIL